jgi:ribosomal protein S11
MAAMANIGREILSAAGNEMAAFVSGIATFRGYVREARAYATAENRAARRAYFEQQIALIDAKGKAAEKYLKDAQKASEAISRLMENIGLDVSAFMEKNGQVPNGKEVNEMISKHISSDIRKIVEGANDPAKDVFYGLRRGDDSAQ